MLRAILLSKRFEIRNSRYFTNIDIIIFFKFIKPSFEIFLENTHWQADNELTCYEFAKNKWCENGGVGSAWNHSWTWDKNSEGLDARDACLICGAKEGI